MASSAIHRANCVFAAADKLLCASEGIAERIHLLVLRPHGLGEFIRTLFSYEPPRQSSAAQMPKLALAPLKEADATADLRYTRTFIDTLGSLLFEIGCVSEHAFLSGGWNNRSFVAGSVSDLPAELVLPKLCAMFARVTELMLFTAATPLAGMRAFKTAHALCELLDAEPMFATMLTNEYAEEVRFVLTNPKVTQGIGVRRDFFVRRARPLYRRLLDTCVRLVESSTGAADATAADAGSSLARSASRTAAAVA